MRDCCRCVWDTCGSLLDFRSAYRFPQAPAALSACHKRPRLAALFLPPFGRGHTTRRRASSQGAEYCKLGTGQRDGPGDGNRRALHCNPSERRGREVSLRCYRAEVERGIPQEVPGVITTQAKQRTLLPNIGRVCGRQGVPVAQATGRRCPSRFSTAVERRAPRWPQEVGASSSILSLRE
jgi:hypothetical protein